MDLDQPKTKETDSTADLNQYAKQKLNELYLYWIGKKESQDLMYSYTESQLANNQEVMSIDHSSPIVGSPSSFDNTKLIQNLSTSASHNKAYQDRFVETIHHGGLYADSHRSTSLTSSPTKSSSNNFPSASRSLPKNFLSPRSPKSQVMVDEVDITVSSIQHKLSAHDGQHHHHPQHITAFTHSTADNIDSGFTSIGSDHAGNIVSISNSLQFTTPTLMMPPNGSTPPKSPVHSPTRTLPKPIFDTDVTFSNPHSRTRKKLNFSDELDYGATDNIHLRTGILQRKLREIHNVALNYESQKKKMKMTVENASFSIIPRFYFPNERPQTNEKIKQDIFKIKQVFLGYPSGIDLEQFGKLVIDVCDFPSFFRLHLFSRIDELDIGKITCEMFEDFWKKNIQYDNEYLRYFNAIKQKSNDYIVPSDFGIIIRELLAFHPGLTFLNATPDFQEKYAETVIIRIFYSINRSGNGRISFREFKNSNLVESLKLLEKEQDTNSEINFFAYEHFYVLYCKFWELDIDRDGMLSRDDLAQYNDSSLTDFIIDRIMGGYGKRLTARQPGMMSYEDFVWFCLSEEDKTTPVSQEYWFRCVDIDGDGVLSLYELEQVFAEQKERIKQYDPEISFSDIHCQIIDMLKPKNRDAITLSDIKKSKMSPIFFNILFNLNKFFVFEQRGTLGTSNVWAQYAKEEYARMVSEDEEQSTIVDMVDEEIEAENNDSEVQQIWD